MTSGCVQWNLITIQKIRLQRLIYRAIGALTAFKNIVNHNKIILYFI